MLEAFPCFLLGSEQFSGFAQNDDTITQIRCHPLYASIAWGCDQTRHLNNLKVETWGKAIPICHCDFLFPDLARTTQQFLADFHFDSVESARPLVKLGLPSLVHQEVPDVHNRRTLLCISCATTDLHCFLGKLQNGLGPVVCAVICGDLAKYQTHFYLLFLHFPFWAYPGRN